jgi:hypothetical protein
MHKILITKIIIFSIFLNYTLKANSGFVNGTVISDESEPMVGANVLIENTSRGVITDSKGQFFIDSLLPGSYTFTVDYIGYKKISKTLIIISEDQDQETSYLEKIGIEDNTDIEFGLSHSNLIFKIEPDPVALRQVDVTAHEIDKNISDILKQAVFGPSKIRESYMTVGASIDAVSIKDIKMSPALNFYEGLDDIKEVETKQLSTVYTSLIVRGVGVTDARDYSQLVDGMQSTNLNYGNNFGNITGLSEIDVANIELIHGAASVMYGPYSTSGLVLIGSKTPWYYQGLSYQLKTGFNHKTDIATSPFLHSAIRFAKAYDKFAWKFVYSNKSATEWEEPGDSTFLQSNPDSKSVFDLKYVHGDDAPLNETSIGTLDSLENAIYGPIARTGYWDGDITETAVYNTKLNASLNYKITDDIELSYNLKGGWGSFTNVGIGKFWNNHSGGINNGLALNGSNWLLRAYTYREGQSPFNNSDEDIQWDIRAIAIEMQNYSKPDNIWLADYKAVFDGEVAGINSGNHEFARDFADSEQSIDTNNTYRARLIPGTDMYNTIYDSLIRRDKQRSPTRLSDNGFYNVEFVYDLTELVKYGGLQVGGNFRKYEVGFDNGIMSNSPELSEVHGPIEPWEYAVFAQGTKWLFNERLKIQGALRFDESEIYGSNFSPSFSTVIKARENNYFRFSYQKATLNPSLFWSFLNIPQQNLKMALGGARQNLERLGLEELHDKAILMDFTTGDTTHIKIPYPTGEKLSAYEVGYKALVNDNLFFDINYYYNHKTNLRDDDNLVFLEEQILWTPISDSIGYATPLDFPYYVYTHNEENEQTIHGLSLGLSYNFKNGLILSGNYNFISEVDTLIAYQPNRIEGSNVGTSRPKNRYKISLNHPRAFKNNIGYSISARYTEKYWYDNYLWYGVGELGGNLNVDAQLSYILSDYNMLVKVGVNNLLGQYYNTSVVTPKIGSTFYISIDYDGLIK